MGRESSEYECTKGPNMWTDKPGMYCTSWSKRPFLNLVDSGSGERKNSCSRWHFGSETL